MFEKEAEEYGEKDLGDKYLSSVVAKDKLHAYKLGQYDGFIAGAEFGYNKAKEDADKMKSRFLELCNLKDMRIDELEKANEWHYVKDGDLPKPTTPVLVILESGVPYVSWISSDKGWWFCTNYYTGEDKVIAWKEIVLPELPKESE